MKVDKPQRYALAVARVRSLIEHDLRANEPEVSAYLIIRAAGLEVRARRGARDVAALFYRLADEFAAEDAP